MKVTAEQVRAGMVFEYLPTGVRVTTVRLYSERPQTIVCRPHAWECNPGGILVEVGPEFAFLGCDPTLAARADCEQYGIAPGRDACAHGFARTRDGGAVDLSRIAHRGLVTEDGIGQRRRMFEDAAKAFQNERFVGLDARYASPEDALRLCCGAPNEREGHTLKHITETGKRNVVCTLAIGDHAEHEDIAAGVKWPATMTGTWSSGMAGAPVAHVGALVNDGSGDMRPAQPASGASFDKNGRLTRPVSERLSFTGSAPRPDLYPDSLAGLKEAIAADPGGLVVPEKADPCNSPLPGFYIGSLRFDCTVHAPTKRGGDLKIDFDAPMATDADRDAYYLMRDHLDAGRDCQFRAGNSTVSGTAVQWTRAADPQRRNIDKFSVMFRPSDEQPAPTPKVSPTAARDAAVAKAVADVPAGCDAERWGGVARLIACDLWEGSPGVRQRENFAEEFAADIGDAAPSIAAYARARFVFGYSPADAAQWVMTAERAAENSATRGSVAIDLPPDHEMVKFAQRLFAAYEAGR